MRTRKEGRRHFSDIAEKSPDTTVLDQGVHLAKPTVERNPCAGAFIGIVQPAGAGDLGTRSLCVTTVCKRLLRVS